MLKKTQEKLDTIINRILSVIALVNFMLLFFSISLKGIIFDKYIAVMLIIFVISILLNESRRRITYKRILLRMPDILILLLVVNDIIPGSLFMFYILGRQSLIGINRLSKRNFGIHHNNLFDYLSENPSVYIMVSFILMISLGTMLLMLPSAIASNKSISFIDALFTATSATCVTGLIVYDTGTYFSLFGQIVILFLIQIGALGIMTISGAFFVLIGQKMKMRSETLISKVVGESNKFDMAKMLRNIIMTTVLIELIGVELLYWRFSKDLGHGLHTLYVSIFHSISAFCNAGFSLFNNSLMKWYNDIPITLIISILIIIGGLGFPVISELLRIIRQKKKLIRLNLHTKIVLVTTIALLFLGTLLFFFAEYDNIMKDYSLKDRLITSYFQSVTTRTAGFNTIDNSKLSDSSILSSIFLMYVGASPGSTGGGLKTTTFFILIATVVSMYKGRKDATAFNRKISEIYIKRVVVLISTSLGLLMVTIFLFLYIEELPFTKIVFEAFSAFGTVGLSMGITRELSNISKLMMIILMYLGRIGPLTLGYAVIQRIKKTQFDLIEEKINIG